MEFSEIDAIEGNESSQPFNKNIKNFKEMELSEEDKAWQENAYFFLV